MSSLDEIKDYDGLSFGQWRAIGTKMGGLDNVLAVLRGEKKITLLEDVVRILVDRNGRCIPQEEVTASVCDTNTSYHFSRLTGEADYVTIPAWEEMFGQEAGMAADEFEARIKAVKERVATWPIADKPQIVNLFNGPHFPIILPQLPAEDYGTIIESKILPVVERAYLAAFPQRRFVNYRKNDPAGKTTIVDGRHAKLVVDLQQGPITGIMCYPLQGFSVHAQQQMASLMPEFISLAGAIELGVTIAMFPKELARDANTPIQDCSAVQWQGAACSLCFCAYDGRLFFAHQSYLGYAYDCYSGGFFVRG